MKSYINVKGFETRRDAYLNHKKKAKNLNAPIYKITIKEQRQDCSNGLTMKQHNKTKQNNDKEHTIKLIIFMIINDKFSSSCSLR